jgi:Holliday junction resolvase
MDGQRFERDIVKCFNTHFENANINAIAYRFERSSHYTVQPADVLVDSAEPQFYLAIECKSFDPKGPNGKLYFSSAFSDATGIPQLERMRTFLTKSGREGHVAVEAKIGARLTAHILPFYTVYALSKRSPGLSLKTIHDDGHPLIREKGSYSF